LSLCFNRDSILIDAPNITLPLGYSGNSTYISILTALSSGKRKVKEIADSLKMENNALSTFLARMMEGGSIERKTMFNGNQKSNYYEISDPFIRFYYRIIYPSLPDIESGIGASVKEECEPIINDMIAHGFENTAISYLEERNQKGLLPGVYHPFRRYVVDNSALGRSIEIDALSDSLDGKHLFVMEAKFKQKSVSKAVLDHLKEGVSIFASHYSKIHYCLFSKTSFSKDILQLKDPSLVLITLDEMMAVE
ncbi:MAG: ArsR family transcriptional regulator, partial [Bacilli bacterium]|nr:ArsR family transcriptional regulator [Bacilli bacterium]